MSALQQLLLTYIVSLSFVNSSFGQTAYQVDGRQDFVHLRYKSAAAITREHDPFVPNFQYTAVRYFDGYLKYEAI